MLDKFKNRAALQIAMAAGLVAVIAVVLFIIGADTKSVADEVIFAKGEIDIQRRQADELARLRGESEKAKPKFAILEEIFPSRDDLFSFPDEISDLAGENGVTARLTFDSEDDGSIGYKLAVQGSYEGINGFIKAIEDNIPFMSMTSVDVILSGDVYNAEISGRVFFNGEEG